MWLLRPYSRPRPRYLVLLASGVIIVCLYILSTIPRLQPQVKIAEVPGLTLTHTLYRPTQTPDVKAEEGLSPVFDDDEVLQDRMFPYTRLLGSGDNYRLPADVLAVTLDDMRIHGRKYFKEHPSNSHYDARFASRMRETSVSTNRMVALRKLFLAWSHFADEIVLPYWIAHGTLLGWYFGGRFMPWDDDIDVQVVRLHSLY